MDQLSDFEALVGKELKVVVGEASLPITVDSATALKPIEDCEDDSVRKQPFSVMFSSALQDRVPEGIHKVVGDGVETEIYLDPCNELGGLAENHTYEAVFG